jgi:branched-chain amino acid transport system ATP-binding protein
VTLLKLDSVTAHYGHLQALQELSLSLREGEILSVIGANGAGKSTLLSIVSGELHPRQGHVYFNDADITKLAPHERVRCGIALVPEGRHLFGNLTVEDNLLCGMASKRRGDWDLTAVYDLFPFVKARRKHRAGVLSGGEQQAVAIGRALMTNPSLLLLDEVSLGLAPVIIKDLYVALRRIAAEGTTLLLVEQNITEALSVADYAICLLEGSIVLEGVPTSLSQEAISDAYFGHSKMVGSSSKAESEL